MKLDRKTLAYLFSNNVTVTGYVNHPIGCEKVDLTIDNFQSYVDDVELFSAEYFDATREQYQKWMEVHGTPQCGEKTKKGKRCKKPCGSGQQSMEDWLAEDGGICSYHEREEWRAKLKRV